VETKSAHRAERLAEQEGHKRVARLFRAAADAETVHARNHLKVMQGIKSTKENLETAIGGENHEFTEMYPEFIKKANAEGEKKAADSFDLANKVEKIHHNLYRDALGKLGSDAVDDLISTLRDINTNARIGAIEALGEIKDKRAAPSLIHLLEDAQR
jgi:rubrerythrin